MQRLRRIKQLGVSEFVFPGATHTRFAHSVGVFHTSRQLCEIIKRELADGAMGTYDPERAEVAVLAALLHDVGHGPLSHAFEGTEKAVRGTKKKHETWSAEMVTSGSIRDILLKHRPSRATLADDIAALLVKEVPEDIYDAVVSSSFDADRLDYLRRDRLMTGTGAGAIDFDWLLDNLIVHNIDMEPGETVGDEGDKRPSFCLGEKAVQAAEAFLLARYQLYEQVYLHKTTRGIERMIGALLLRTSELAKVEDGHRALNLPNDHPLIVYYQAETPTLTQYMSLDDTVVWGAIERMEHASDDFIRQMATRLRNRDLYKGLDVATICGTSPESQRKKIKKVTTRFKNEAGREFLRDESNVSIYGEIGADDAKAQKRLMIMTADGPTEITRVSEITKVAPEKQLVRFYFSTEAARNEARQI